MHRFSLYLSFIIISYLCSILSRRLTTAAFSRMSNPGNDYDATAVAAKDMIDFLTIARGLKTTPRTGWIRQEASPRIESVADHSWRISLMAMVASSSSASKQTETNDDVIVYDQNKCIKMALVHDLAEATVGDITPHCGVSDEDKHTKELHAMTYLTTKLSTLGGGDTSVTGQEILSLWKEYEAGTTNEAKLVKDMDKLEMILQALEYEQDGKNGKSLDGFFDSTRGKWRTPIGEAWGKEIESRRCQKQQASSQEQPEVEPDEPANKTTKLT